MKVTFQYYTESEDGCDDYRFSRTEDAQEKFESLKELISAQFRDCQDTEIIDDPDFYGIISHSTGEWAKVFITH